MSDYVADRIEKPPFFRLAPLKLGRGKRVPYVIGYDSEADTATGRPMLLQFSLPEHRDESETILLEIPDDPMVARGRFLQFIAMYCTRKDTEYLIYGFNLEYEYTQLFHDLPDTIKRQPEFELTTELTIRDTGQDYRFRIRAMNDKRHLATIENLSTKRQVRLLDAMSFFKTSLGKAAKMLELGDKYESDAIDRERFTRADLHNPEFLRYARQDAYITRRIGEHIVGMHVTYGISQTISAPHFASKVFRRRFLTGLIEHPAPDLEQAGLWSYHGGKNGFYLDGPARLPDVWQYDITSAYPEAMRQLPDPELATWESVNEYRPGRHAIYCATLRYRRCKYRGMMTLEGHWPESGIIERVYLTGYELDAMVERGECDVLSASGWMMVGPRGGPLVRYVDEFFSMKARTVGPERETAKLFLNSLYGKFFQKVALGRVGSLDLDSGEWIVTDPDSPYDWRAGGLYHPPIASLITGYVRAKIHGIEHKYESLMTSTDGVFGMVPPDRADLGKQLGKLTARRGDLKIWRERVYIFRPTPDVPCEPSCAPFAHAPKCDNAEKVALHGFRAKPAVLDTIPLAHGSYTYQGRQMVTLKLSTIGLNGERYEPGRFVDLPYTIAI